MHKSLSSSGDRAVLFVLVTRYGSYMLLLVLLPALIKTNGIDILAERLSMLR